MRFILICCLLNFTIISCDPPRDLYDTATIEINAQVINPATNIQLGDSVAFYFEVPDSVILNNTRVKVNISNSDGGNIGLTPFKILSSSIGGSTNNPALRTAKLYANPGKLSVNETLQLENKNGRLLAKLYMIPQERGVYYLLQSQQGYIDLNDNRLKLRFSINFGPINRNHQLLIDSAGPSNNFTLYLQDKINQGLEVYGFRVI
jgi:hypothetical protein